MQLLEKLHVGPFDNDLPEYSQKDYEDLQKILPMILTKSEYEKVIEAEEKNKELFYYSCYHIMN